jgi:hypothetical protein
MVAAMLAADTSSVLAASEATGIPRRTLRSWLEHPEYAELRHNAREAMIEEAIIVARLAWQKLALALANDELEPRDLVIAAGMATDKSQLLSGGATGRTELRDITGTISDTELIAALHEAESLVRGQGEAETASEGEGL